MYGDMKLRYTNPVYFNRNQKNEIDYALFTKKNAVADGCIQQLIKVSVLCTELQKSIVEQVYVESELKPVKLKWDWKHKRQFKNKLRKQ